MPHLLMLPAMDADHQHGTKHCQVFLLILIVLLLSTCDDHPVSCGEIVLGSSNSTLSEEVDVPCKYSQDIRHSGGIVVDCGNQNLTYLNSSWFPPSATEIYLDSNYLSQLENSTFEMTIHLLVLSISRNRLNSIAPAAFKGLNSLELLDLEHNLIALDRLSENMFWDLKNIKSLKLAYNRYTEHNRAEMYPENLLKGLFKLELLTLDTFPDKLEFGRLFQNSTHLTDLFLTGDLSAIRNESFKSFDTIPLKSLTLYNLENLEGIDINAFGPLTQLQSLNITKTTIGLEKTLNSLYPFQNKNLTSLTLDCLVSLKRFRQEICSSALFDKSIARYLSQMCIKHFHLRNSYVFYIALGSFSWSAWRDCVVTIDLSGNPLIGNIFVLIQMHDLNVLKSFKIENCRNIFGAKSLASQAKRASDTNEIELASLVESKILLGESYKTDHNMTVVLPPLLETITFRRCGVEHIKLSYNFSVENGEHVRHMQLRENGFECTSGLISGLSNIEFLDLSYNNGGRIKEHFFDSFSSLKILKLAGMEFNDVFMGTNSSRLFKNLANLEVLDLSDNDFNDLQSNVLHNSTQIKELDLSHNKLSSLSIDLSTFTKLQHLNLSQNSITFLSHSDIQSLELIRECLNNLSISLAGNPFYCDCSTFNFLVWLNRTFIHLDNDRNYRCLGRYGIFITTKPLIENLDAMWLECHGRTSFYAAIILWLIAILIFVLTFGFKHFKTFTIYFFLRIFVPNVKLKARTDYQFGVYLGYSDVDYRFACFDLREFLENNLKVSTYIRDRDLLPSLDMAESIVDVINASWRVVLMVTPDFLQFESWTYFAVKTAVYSVSPLNPKKIILIVDDNVVDQIPEFLLKVVPEDNIIEMRMPFHLSYKGKRRLKDVILE